MLLEQLKERKERDAAYMEFERQQEYVVVPLPLSMEHVNASAETCGWRFAPGPWCHYRLAEKKRMTEEMYNRVMGIMDNVDSVSKAETESVGASSVLDPEKAALKQEKARLRMKSVTEGDVATPTASKHTLRMNEVGTGC